MCYKNNLKLSPIPSKSLNIIPKKSTDYIAYICEY